ncbi:hypothetical protein AVEN_260896-1 [Araneus ventricosus]|uniref:Uncharacterized protein n=1 Tax=Araneus ventricosus TaxID=182803 RepID=A0A4Y2HDT7_ARAVE|nr:hypothetical protein AVEN_260896-1 [Araneus ventricosus]
MFGNAFVIEYDDLNGVFNGRLCDKENNGLSFLNLRALINLMFAEHNVGILIVAGSPYGLMYYYDKFHFTDSIHADQREKAEHKMEKSVSSNVILLTREFLRTILRTVHSNAGTQFSINAINVVVKEVFVPMQQYLDAHPSM